MVEKCWIYDRAYWQGPEEEMQPTAVEVPQQPDLYCKWTGSEWTKDIPLLQRTMRFKVEKEIDRLKKFLLLPDVTIAPLKPTIDSYIATLRGSIDDPPLDAAMPVVPDELTDDSFYAKPL